MSLKDFFGKTNVSEWTCENVVNYYWENVSQYATLKRILYDINSELKQIKQVLIHCEEEQLGLLLMTGRYVCSECDELALSFEGDKVSFCETKEGVEIWPSWDTLGRPVMNARFVPYLDS